MRRRWRILGLMLAMAATGGLVWYAPDPIPSTEYSIGGGESSTREVGPRVVSPIVALPERQSFDRPNARLFEAHQWAPVSKPAPPAPIAAPSPPPVPTLPFKFAGHLSVEGGDQVFLTKGDALIPIRVGDVIDGTYRVDRITTTEIGLTYLPLGVAHQIAVNTAIELAGGSSPTQHAQESSRALSSDSRQATVDAKKPSPAQPAQTGVQAIPTAPETNVLVGENTSPPDSRAAVASFRWEGPQLTKAGSSFEVSLSLSAGQPVRIAPVQVRFDPTQLEPILVRSGKLLGEAGAKSFAYRVQHDGSVFVGSMQPAEATAPDGQLLVFLFKALKADVTAQVNVVTAGLRDDLGKELSHEPLQPFRIAVER